MIARILQAGWAFLQNLTGAVLGFLATLLAGLVQGIITVLKLLFAPVLMVIALILYFIYKIAAFFILLLSVVLDLGRLLYGFVMGFFKTVSGFTWASNLPANHGSWSHPIQQSFELFGQFQLDKIAYVLMFCCWVFTAFAAIKILSGGKTADE